MGNGTNKMTTHGHILIKEDNREVNLYTWHRSPPDALRIASLYFRVL